MGRARKGEEDKKKQKKRKVEEEEEEEEVDEEAVDDDGEEEVDGDKENEVANEAEAEEEEAKAPATKRQRVARAEADDDDGGGGDDYSRVVGYLRRANRPYSLPVLFENLHREPGKAALQRILDSATEKKALTSKEFGKAVLYWATQADSSEAGPSSADIEKETMEVEARLAEVRATVAALQAEVNGLVAEPSDDALDAELAELEKAVPALERRLERLQGKGEGEAAVSPDEVDGLQRRLNAYLAAWKARKKGMKEIVGLVAENAAKSWKEKKFCEDLGVETDEQAKLNIADYLSLQRDVKEPPKGKGAKGK